MVLLPSYDGKEPTKTAGLSNILMTSMGWSPVNNTVTGDTEYTTVFTEKINEYVITFNYKN